MADVFISYSRKDKEFVHRLQEAMVEHEREAWLDTKDIPPTAEWLQEIYAAIEKADSFVCVISPDVLGSEFCQIELAHAVKHHKRLIPVVRRDVDPKAVPDILARLNWIFCREGDDFSQAFEALLTAIATDLDHVRVHTRLLLKALEWEGRGREKSLLLRGGELKRGEEWLAIGDKEPQPTDLMRQFLLASRQGATARQRVILGAVSMALVVAVGLAVAAFYQYRVAQDQKELALARQLTAQSELLRSQQPYLLNRSVLLAVESIHRRATLEASLALQRGLALLPKRLATMQVERELSQIIVSPDGVWLAGWDSGGFNADRTALRPGKVWLWETETGRLVTSLPQEAAPYLLVGFSPDSQRLITFSENGSLRVTAVADGREVSQKTLDIKEPWKTALSPDGKLLAVSDGPSVTVYDTGTGRELASITLAKGSMAMVFTPDSAKLVVGCEDGTVELWQVLAGSFVTRAKIPRYVESLAVSPDGQYLAAVVGIKTQRDEETETRVWHLPTGRETARIFQAGGGSHLAFSQNGLLMTTSSSKGITVWRSQDGRQVFQVKPPYIHGAALSPTGRWLAVTVDHAVQVYDLTTGRETKPCPMPMCPTTFSVRMAAGYSTRARTGWSGGSWMGLKI